MKISRLRKMGILAILMLAGESVFLLPFVLVRIFRPTFLEAFEITNFQLGTAFSIYGVVAMISYFLGGPIADRFSSRRLLSVSLFLTAVGGLFLASQPSFILLIVLYGFWGVSSILLFWAAFIKAIRYYGGEQRMGSSYGWVDAGRGLTAALMASISVGLYDYFLTVDIAAADQLNKIQALTYIMIFFCIITALSGFLVLLIKDEKSEKTTHSQLNWKGMKAAALNRRVWWQALVVMCAYVAYKSTDDISLYGTEVLYLDEVAAGHLAALTFWLRPVGALAAGYLGDRYGISRMCQIAFILVILASLSLANPGLIGIRGALAMIAIAIGSLGIYGLRGLYFALFKENEIALMDTGAAVGLISVVGYTPDVFFGPLMGWILDASPGAEAHQNLFLVVAGFALLGLIASRQFRKQV